MINHVDMDTINELLKRQPFWPFKVKFSDQDTVDIVNPALVVVMKRDIFIADPSRDHFHIYSLMHVVGIESAQAA